MARKSCPSAACTAESINESTEQSQNQLHLCVQGRHAYSWTYGTDFLSSLFKAESWNIGKRLLSDLTKGVNVTSFVLVFQDPQYGCKDKSVTFFASGNISMDIHTERMGYQQGDILILWRPFIFLKRYPEPQTFPFFFPFLWFPLTIIGHASLTCWENWCGWLICPTSSLPTCPNKEARNVSYSCTTL